MNSEKVDATNSFSIAPQQSCMAETEILATKFLFFLAKNGGLLNSTLLTRYPLGRSKLSRLRAQSRLTRISFFFHGFGLKK